MQKKDFYFNLPTHLIAQEPKINRIDSRLLIYQKYIKKALHKSFANLTDYLIPGDVLVLNDSKVIPARLYGKKASGGKVELLIEKILAANRFLAHIKCNKKISLTSIIYLGDWEIKIIDKAANLYHCQIEGDVNEMLDSCGQLPLPPYIKRKPSSADLERYQTVYALHDGSIAAPTAGLHFDKTMLDILANKGITTVKITLHVGSGTFQPVRTANIADHKMHAEEMTIPEEAAEKINSAIKAGNRIIAVGTTSLRALESAATKTNFIDACSKATNIFIYPGYKFRICKGLITNFHLPESTLLMLVAAFIGYSETMELYNEAIRQNYRFFSYGDACFLI